MKIDLVGPKQRGLSMGLNEFAGYFAVEVSALATGYVATNFGLRPQPFYLGIGYVAVGLLLSVLMIRETKHHAALEAKSFASDIASPSQKEVFLNTSFRDRTLSSVCQAGFVNNLNDGMVWPHERESGINNRRDGTGWFLPCGVVVGKIVYRSWARKKIVLV